MTASDAATKVEELMSALDQIKKYRAQIPAIAALLVTVLIAISILLIAVFISNLLRLFYSFNISFLYPPVFVLSFVLLFIGIEVGLRRARKRISEVKYGEWRSETSQGFSGSIKVLSEIDWDRELNEIKASKSNLVNFAILKTAIYWVSTLLLSELFNLLISVTFLSINIPLILLGPLTLLISIILAWEDIMRGYRTPRSLEILYWQLRSFYSEFRRKEQELGVRS
jgi:hypothetical protein